MTAAQIDQMIARELPTLPPSVAVAGKDWKANVPSLTPPKLTPGDTDLLELAIGTSAPVRCALRRDLDAASTATVFHSVFADLGEGITVASVKPEAVLLAGSVPVMTATTIYTVEKAETRAFGELKMAIGTLRRGVVVICNHDEPGYHKSFGEIVRRVVESLADGSAEAEVELVAATLQNEPVGFSHSWKTRDEKGGDVYRSANALMIRRTPTELVYSDTYAEQTIKKQRVESGVWAKVENGDAASVIRYHHLKGSKYAYEGLLKKKKVEGTFDAGKAGLPLPHATEARLAKLMSKPEFSFEEREYTPSLSLDALSVTTYSRKAGDPLDRARTTFEGLEALEILNPDGSARSLEMSLGTVSMQLKQLYRSGSGTAAR